MKWKGNVNYTIICHFKTESNCPVPRNHNNNSSNERNDADGAGVVAEEIDENLGEETSGTSGNGVKTGVRELGETPKPMAKSTKKSKDQSEFQNRVLQLVDQEEDELGMTLTALGKKN